MRWAARGDATTGSWRATRPPRWARRGALSAGSPALRRSAVPRPRAGERCPPRAARNKLTPQVGPSAIGPPPSRLPARSTGPVLVIRTAEQKSHSKSQCGQTSGHGLRCADLRGWLVGWSGSRVWVGGAAHAGLPQAAAMPTTPTTMCLAEDGLPPRVLRAQGGPDHHDPCGDPSGDRVVGPTPMP